MQGEPEKATVAIQAEEGGLAEGGTNGSGGSCQILVNFESKPADILTDCSGCEREESVVSQALGYAHGEACATTSWLDYCSKVYFPSSVKPLIIIFRGHSLGNVHSHPDLLAVCLFDITPRY